MPSTPLFEKPRLPSHYLVRFEPPDSSGDEVLVFRSQRRTLKLKGHSFREFHQRVVPLLDGRRTLDEIEREVADVFAPEDLRAGLELLREQGLLAEGDGDAPPGAGSGRAPQANYFHELGLDSAQAQARLGAATVAVFGAGALGAAAARPLAAAGVGTLRLVDDQPVGPADPYLTAGLLAPDRVGSPRAEAVAAALGGLDRDTRFEPAGDPLASDEEVVEAIAGADFVVAAIDPGLSSLTYKLNRACLATGTPWISGAVDGFEGVVGPKVRPGETPCYLCYQMRSVACSDHPETEFAHLKHLDRRRRDDSGEREALVFGFGVVGNLLGLETCKALLSLPSSLAGSIVVVDFHALTSTRHKVLRKPWCPACYPADAEPRLDRPAGGGDPP